MPTALQHTSLVIRVLDLLHLDHLLLLQNFNSVEALVVLRLHQVHAAKGAGAEGTLEVEVGQRVLALGLTRGIAGRLVAWCVQLRHIAVRVGGAAAVGAIVLRAGLVQHVLDAGHIVLVVAVHPSRRRRRTSAGGAHSRRVGAGEGVGLVAEGAVLAEHTVHCTAVSRALLEDGALGGEVR